MRKVLVALSAVAVYVSFVSTLEAQDSVRHNRRTAISFHLASNNPLAGMEAKNLGRDNTIYVSKHAVLSAADVSDAESIASRDGSDVEIVLSANSAMRLANETARTGADMLAISVSGKIIAAGSVTIDQITSTALITGLDSVNAERIAGMIVGIALPVGPTITLVSSQSNIMPGGTVTVDAFVRGVADLRTYQITLLVSGGSSGKLEGQDLWVDHARENYVFGIESKLDAVDQTGGRIGGVLMSGSVDATNSSYLGSFILQASPDASGSFTIDLKTSDRSSLIWSSGSRAVTFGSQPAIVQVGSVTRVKLNK